MGEDLSNRVGQLFMLDNDFFRSPFMRDKIPKAFFSNGLESAGFSTPSLTSSRNFNPAIRDVPIRVHGSNANSTVESDSPVADIRPRSAVSPLFKEISSVRHDTPTFGSASNLRSNHERDSQPRVQSPETEFAYKYLRRDPSPLRPSLSVQSFVNEPPRQLSVSVTSRNAALPPKSPNFTGLGTASDIGNRDHSPMRTSPGSFARSIGGRKPSATFSSTFTLTPTTSDTFNSPFDRPRQDASPLRHSLNAQPTTSESERNTHEPPTSRNINLPPRSPEPRVFSNSSRIQPSPLRPSFSVQSVTREIERSDPPPLSFSSSFDLSSKTPEPRLPSRLPSSLSFTPSMERLDSEARNLRAKSPVSHSRKSPIAFSSSILTSTRPKLSLPPLIRDGEVVRLHLDRTQPIKQPSFQSGPALSTSTREFGLWPSTSTHSLIAEKNRNHEPEAPNKSSTTDLPRLPTKPLRANSIPNLTPQPLSRVGDPVEEAIRSLETFDPNEFIDAGLLRSHSVSSPNLKKDEGTSRGFSARHPSSNSLSERFKFSRHKNLPHFCDILRLNCLKISQLAAQSNWNSTGKLESSLADIKESYYVIVDRLQQVLDQANVMVRESSVWCPAGSELRAALNSLDMTLNSLCGMRSRVRHWTPRSVQNDWSSPDGEDIVRLIPNDIDGLMRLLAEIDLNNSEVPKRPPQRVELPPARSFSLSSPMKNSFDLITSAPSDTIDGGESTSSTSTASPTVVESGESNATSNETLTRRPPARPTRADSPAESQIVVEEDDLMSVTSEVAEHPNNWEQPPNTAIDGVPNPFKNHRSGLSDDDLELLELCGAQVSDNTSKLSMMTKEFFNMVEEGHGPDKFVHKAKMIICQLASNAADNLQSVVHKLEFKKASEMLDKTVSYCEDALNATRNQYPSVSAAQSLVSSVNSLSQQAHNLHIMITLATY